MNDTLTYQLQSVQNDPSTQILLDSTITQDQMNNLEDFLKRKNDTEDYKTPVKHNHQEEKENEGINSPEDNAKPAPKRPGRKPLTTMPTDKRKAQNRAAQRAFRERKDKYMKELEDRVKELEDSNEKNHEENEKLRKLLQEVKAENTLLKGNFTFQPPSNALESAPTLVDLLKNSENSPTESPLFSPVSYPWTPTSNSGEVTFIHDTKSPENLGLSSNDDKSPFNTSSPLTLSSQTGTPEISNLLNVNQQTTMFQPPIQESNFFAPIGEIVDDPLISIPQEFTSPQIFETSGESNINLPFNLSDYRDASAVLFDDNLPGDLSTLPGFFDEGWNDEFNAGHLFSPVQTSPNVADAVDNSVASHSEAPAVSHNKDINISLEDCKVLEFASLPLDFDINELCEELRKKATCGGRFPCPEKTEQLAQL